MKPAPFEYSRPATLAQAIATYDGTEDASLLAGGQSLVPLMNMRLARPVHVIDLNEVDGLAGLRAHDSGLEIGAMTRQSAVEAAPATQERVPLLAEALRHVAHPQIRNRGTIGGSLAHADPAAELPAVARALDAVLVAEGPAGTRRIAAADFFVSFFTTSLEPPEILTAVEFPAWPPDRGWAFEEFARRRGDFALVGAAVVVDRAGGEVADARLALTGVGTVPVRCTRAEDALRGAPVDDAAAVADAAGVVAAEIDPASDTEGSSDYRTALAVELVRRATLRALERAGPGPRA